MTNTQVTSTAKRPPSQIVRVLTNYARLFGALLIGFLLVRILLRFGEDAFGIITLFGAGTGLGMIIQETVRAGTVPILGAAYHSGSVERFRSVLNSALAASLVAGLIVIVIYGILFACIPLFKIPESLWRHAGLFTIAMGLMSLINVVLSPLINFYAVSERMALYNLSGFLLRLADLIAALITLFVVSMDAPGTCVVVYGFVYASLSMLLMAAIAGAAFRIDPLVRLDYHAINRQDIKSFSQSAGWNSGVTLALSLYSKTNTIIYNLFFGITGTVVFGIANQLTFYVRQAVSGLVHGMDAVSARITNSESPDAIRRLLGRSTNHQAIIVLPAAAMMILYSTWIVSYWVGDRLESPEITIPSISTMICILVAGVAARALSDGWLKIMSGDGGVSSYAPWVIAGGVCNPGLAILATWLSPPAFKLFSAAYVFSILTVVVHLAIIPRIVRDRYELTLVEVYRPMSKPLIATVFSVLFAYVVLRLTNHLSFGWMISACIFVVTYSIECLTFVLEKDERNRLLRLLGAGRLVQVNSKVALSKADNG